MPDPFFRVGSAEPTYFGDAAVAANCVGLLNHILIASLHSCGIENSQSGHDFQSFSVTFPGPEQDCLQVWVLCLCTCDCRYVVVCLLAVSNPLISETPLAGSRCGNSTGYSRVHGRRLKNHVW